MILPEPGSEDIPIELNPRKLLPLSPYFKQLTTIATVLILTVGLGLAVKLSQENQNPFKKAGGVPILRVDLSVNQIDSTKYGLSAQAVGDSANEVSYQWGVSSTNSIGSLYIHSSNKYAEFTFNGNEGRADIWVAVDGGITNSYAIAMGPDGPYIPTNPTPTPPSTSYSLSFPRDPMSLFWPNQINQVQQIEAFMWKDGDYGSLKDLIDTLAQWNVDQNYITITDTANNYFDKCPQVRTDLPCIMYSAHVTTQNPGNSNIKLEIFKDKQLLAMNYSSLAIAIAEPPPPSPTPTPTTIIVDDTRCQSKGGNWISQYSDCENIDKNVCSDLGGLFDECASACRYGGDQSQPCIQLCVRVCKLPPLPLPSTTPSPINNAPVITTDYLPTVYTDENYSAEVSATDADGEQLNMEFTNLPAGISKGLCKQSIAKSPSEISCELSGKIQSGQTDYSSQVGVIVTDKRGTAVKKTLYLYVSSPQTSWISWNTKSVNIYGNIELKVDGKKYTIKSADFQSPEVSIENVDSINAKWDENGYSNSFLLGFERDENDWWISYFSGSVGGQNFSDTIQSIKTPLGRPLYVNSVEFNNNYYKSFSPKPYSLKLEYLNIQAFINLNFDPVLETEVLPVARLFGLYSATVSVSDRNIYDYPEVEISNLPLGLKSDNCIKEQDQSILHCLITGRALFIGDYPISIKINGVDHHLVLPVRFSNPEPPKPPEFIISKIEYPPVFVINKSDKISLDITNIGGSERPVNNINLSAKNGLSQLDSKSTCSNTDPLNIGMSCSLIFDQTFTQTGEQTFSVEGLSNDNDSTFSIKVVSSSVTPVTVSVKIPGNHLSTESHHGNVSLIPKKPGAIIPIETNYVYSPEVKDFVANIEIPIEINPDDYDINLKLDRFLSFKYGDPNAKIIAGDFNDDNKLSMADISALLSQYTALSTPTNAQNRKYDINNDGVITMADITMVLSNYTKLETYGE